MQVCQCRGFMQTVSCKVDSCPLASVHASAVLTRVSRMPACCRVYADRVGGTHGASGSGRRQTMRLVLMPAMRLRFRRPC